MVPRWILVPVGLVLAILLIAGLLGASWLVLVPNKEAPIGAPVLGACILIGCLWCLSLCFRMMSGKKGDRGLFGPVVLRVIAWVFLLLPIAGIATGFFKGHIIKGALLSAAYYGLFLGLRALAWERKRN